MFSLLLLVASATSTVAVSIEAINSTSIPNVDTLTAAREQVPGWVIERLFHTDAVQCPWTDTPTEDKDCQYRLSEVERMRRAIATCDAPMKKNIASIGHRGAALIAPEETFLSYKLAIESGASTIECDAAITKDGEFVCRHSLCDLEYTTDILTRPELASKCSIPFSPSENGTVASAKCCTYDFTTKELGELCGLMESSVNSTAQSPEEYITGAPAYRSDYFTSDECHPVILHKDHLKFAKANGMNVIPELKDTWTPETEDFLQSIDKDITWLANKLAGEVRDAGFTAPLDGNWKEAAEKGNLGILQTFDRRVAKIWKEGPYKDLPVEYMWSDSFDVNQTSADCTFLANCGTADVVESLIEVGVEMFSPSIPVLLAANNNKLVESQASKDLKATFAKANHTVFMGAWSLERSGCPSSNGSNKNNADSSDGMLGACGYYYNSVLNKAVHGQHEDILLALDVLFKQVGIISLFADFPASVSAYANCVLDA
eukprot:CFRG6437T1